MGARKRNKANERKEEKKNKSFAVLRNSPISPRKMRLVADMVRGSEVNRALDVLHYSTKDAAKRLEKLILSALANWKQKNEGIKIEDNKIFIQEVFVDQSKTLKRIQPAPQGRAYRVRKRSNHVTVVLGNVANKQVVETEQK